MTFGQTILKTFGGKQAVVVAEDGTEYTGVVDDVDAVERHFVLRGAERDGESVGAAVISNAVRAELVDESIDVQSISLVDITAAPYAAAEFDFERHEGYVNNVMGAGEPPNPPLVRPVETGYEVVDGHKKLWAAREAGLVDINCDVRDLGAFAAAKRFVDDHLPAKAQVDPDTGETANNWYSNAETEAAIMALYERHGERIYSLPRVAFNVDRLDLELASQK